jgi:hypothetical protein
MSPAQEFSHIPIIDVSELMADHSVQRATATRLREKTKKGSGLKSLVARGLPSWRKEAGPEKNLEPNGFCRPAGVKALGVQRSTHRPAAELYRL